MSPLILTDPINQIDLNDLYRSLSKQQIRVLKALLETTDFRYDIIANLPTELVSLVFQQLDLYQSYQCRRVSRRWHELLSSEQVVKALLHSWTATENVPLRAPKASQPHSVLDTQAEHHDAFRTGKPFSSIHIPHGRNFSGDAGLFKHAYSDGLLAWVERSEGCDRICLYELETSAVCHFMPPERENIDEIMLSGKLLAATTASARCYIWSHQTSSLPYTLRLPSRCQNNFHLSDSSLVLHQTQLGSTAPFTYWHSEILVWRSRDLSVGESCEMTPRGEVSKFSALLPSNTSLPSWHDITLDKAQQNIILTECMVNKDKRNNIFRIRHFSISGELLFEGSLERPYSRGITWNVHEGSSRNKERFLEIWMVTKDRQEGQELLREKKTAITHLRYLMDRRVIQLMEQKIICYHHFLPAGQMQRIFPWKGFGYFEQPKWTADDKLDYQLKVMDFRKGTCVEAHVDARRRDDSTIMFLGDEIFLIRMTSSHFVVFCFDKHRPMAGQTILRGSTASICRDKNTTEMA